MAGRVFHMTESYAAAQQQESSVKGAAPSQEKLRELRAASDRSGLRRDRLFRLLTGSPDHNNHFVHIT